MKAVSARKRKASRQRQVAAEPGADLGPLADFFGFNLRLAQDASFRAFARRTGDKRLKPGRFAAMMVIDCNPGLTQKDLGRAIARDKSSVTQLIRELQREGLLERRASELDRRRNAVNLTRHGRAVLRMLLRRAEAHEKRLDAIIGKRKAEIMTLLKTIYEEL